MARTHVEGHYRTTSTRRASTPSRTTAITTTRRRRTSGGGGDLLRKSVPFLVGAGILALLFWPRTAGAATPPGTKALVLSAVQPRTRPDPAAPELYPGDPNPNAPAGLTLDVLETNIKSTSPLSREWWKVRFADGREGYVSAVGPNGEANLRRL